jgi:chitin disaccharide deacetylase
VRRLIVNADDFGLTGGVNRAIVEAHQRGVVTSSTLMATGSAFDQAVRMAQAVPSLGIGCHVVLLDGTSALPGEQVSTLCPSGGSRFPSGFLDFAFRSLRGRISENEIEAEATAQIRKLQNAGIRVSHIDTHKHSHMFPQVLRPLLKAAQACGVKAIRNPLEPIRLGDVAGQPGLWKRWGQVRMLNRLANGFRRAVQEAGMVTPDGSLGIVATGSMTEQILGLMVQHIPEGTWELVCHPGYDDEELARVDTRLRASRVLELEILKSPEIRRKLADSGVELISYHALA